MIIGSHEEFIGTKKQSVISTADFAYFTSAGATSSSVSVLTFKPLSKTQAQAP